MPRLLEWLHRGPLVCPREEHWFSKPHIVFPWEMPLTVLSPFQARFSPFQAPRETNDSISEDVITWSPILIYL